MAQLVATLERVGQVHNFAKGMGLAAPQIGIGRSVAVVRTAEGQSITLLNPRIINQSPETDEQYEGCLSFFDVRGMVPRPLTIEVEHQETDGSLRITSFDRGEARFVHHETTIFTERSIAPGCDPESDRSLSPNTREPGSSGRTQHSPQTAPARPQRRLRSNTGWSVAPSIHALSRSVRSSRTASSTPHACRVWGETHEAKAVRTSPGGKALNQTVALGRLGAHVTPVGVVGDDAHGKEILGVLGSEGVNTHGIQMRQAAETPICVCLIGDDGCTSFMWHIPQEAAITPETIQDAAPAIEEADAVLVTFEISTAATREAIELAHRHGCMVAVQPAPPLRNPDQAATLPWDRVDVVIPNEREARALLSDNDGNRNAERSALAVMVGRALTVPRVVVTLGDAGCAAYTSDSLRHYPAQPVDDTVDATGASDAFTAHLAWHLARHTSGPHAIHAALSAAAIATTRAGGHESMPHAAQLAANNTGAASSLEWHGPELTHSTSWRCPR